MLEENNNEEQNNIYYRKEYISKVNYMSQDAFENFLKNQNYL